MRKDDRFAFGDNWAQFLTTLTPERIELAERSLRERLGDITGSHFLDIGSGSGLFSLAAARLGAIVHSFDYDTSSVACTEFLRKNYAPSAQWTVEQGSALDTAYLARLGTFDVVYSWGVLHHTGDLWNACAGAASAVAPGGRLFVSIYNDQGWQSRYWTRVKRGYCRHPFVRPIIIAAHLPYLGARFAARMLTGRTQLTRGMSLWYDYIDWIGGYPFEVASIAAVRDFFVRRGFSLGYVAAASSGCNEFLFTRS